MHILVTGGTGFIGTALCAHLLGTGHTLTILTRQAREDTSNCRYIRDLQALDIHAPLDAVINLAGESLARGRWTAARRRTLWESRVTLTEELVARLAQMPQPPRVLLNGSAVGYYGHPDRQSLSENAAPADDFPSQLCQAWEAAALPAEQLGMRVCLLRLGVVLDAGGGALAQMSLPFRLGVSSWPGHGRQVLSWIHRADVVKAIDFLLDNPALRGAFNLTAPEPVTQRQLAAALRAHFRTWLTVPAPAPLLRLALGPMADALLLQGSHVVPAALLKAGYGFRYAELPSALAAIYLQPGAG